MEIFSEATPELVNHALLARDVLLSETGELLKHDVVLVNRHSALLQVAEFLTLVFNNALRNVMSFES